MLNKFFINIIALLLSILFFHVYANEPVDIWSLDKKKGTNKSEILNIENNDSVSENNIIQENLISNIEMTVSKSDLKISKLYVDELLGEEYQEIYEDILSESKLVTKMIKQIKQNTELLNDNKVLKNTLNIRNAYLDPLSLIQVSLMKKMRKKELSQFENNALLLSINGLAAGLRNTGW